MIQDSEYLETHLIAVPNTITKDFFKTYETISPMVVPRSAQLIDADDEFTLYAVTTFRKHSSEFVHKCRESKWTPRDFKYKEGGKEEERKEVGRVGKEERKVWGEALRLGRTAWGEAVMAWVHVLALRVFVETVLRYGLPLQYVCGLVRVCQVPGHLSNTSGRLLRTTDTPPSIDYAQAGKESAKLIGRFVLIPGGKCLRSRQERQSHQG